MKKKDAANQTADTRQQMIDSLIQMIHRLGDRELDLVYRFVKRLSE